jgi:hypothetical protein
MHSDPSVAAASPAVILRSPALRDDEKSLYCVCPRGADFHSLAMFQCERVFRHECGATHAPLRVNDCQFALGFASANLSKNRELLPSFPG